MDADDVLLPGRAQFIIRDAEDGVARARAGFDALYFCSKEQEAQAALRRQVQRDMQRDLGVATSEGSTPRMRSNSEHIASCATYHRVDLAGALLKDAASHAAAAAAAALSAPADLRRARGRRASVGETSAAYAAGYAQLTQQQQGSHAESEARGTTGVTATRTSNCDATPAPSPRAGRRSSITIYGMTCSLLPPSLDEPPEAMGLPAAAVGSSSRSNSTSSTQTPEPLSGHSSSSAVSATPLSLAAESVLSTRPRHGHGHGHAMHPRRPRASSMLVISTTAEDLGQGPAAAATTGEAPNLGFGGTLLAGGRHAAKDAALLTTAVAAGRYAAKAAPAHAASTGTDHGTDTSSLLLLLRHFS